MVEQPDGKAQRRPKLHLVSDGEEEPAPVTSKPESVPEPARRRPSPRAASQPARAAQADRLSEAEAHCSHSADPESTYKSLLQLSRPSHGDVLQALPYNKALEFHDPRCVKVEPEPQRARRDRAVRPCGLPGVRLGSCWSRSTIPANDHLFNSLRHLLFTRERERGAGHQPRPDHRHRPGDRRHAHVDVQRRAHLRGAGRARADSTSWPTASTSWSRGWSRTQAGLRRAGDAGAPDRCPHVPVDSPDRQPAAGQARSGPW